MAGLVHLGTRWGPLLASLRGGFIPGERSPVSHWTEDWCRLWSWSGRSGDEKSPYLPGIELRFLCRLALCLVTIPTTLSRLIAYTDWKSYVRVIVIGLGNCALSSRMKGSSAVTITGVNEQLYKEQGQCYLTLTPLTWRIGWAHNNARK